MPTKARTPPNRQTTKEVDLPSQSNILSTQSKPQPEYLSVKDVAALLSIREATARALLRRGKLPGTRLGDGPWRVRRVELEKMFSPAEK